MVEAIIFDLEGVIADTEHLWDRECQLLLDRRGRTWTATSWDELKARLAGQSFHDGAIYIKEQLGLPDDVADLVDERFTNAATLFKTAIAFVPGFQELWQQLEPEEYKAAVATSLHPTLFSIVQQQLSLPSYFGNHLHSIGDVGWKSKPDPAVFLLAAEKLHVPPERCVVIEDAPNGIIGARTAGMKTIGFARTLGRDYIGMADIVIDTLPEAIKHIRNGL